MKELLNIQQQLKAPKNQRNKFGGYNYRSCEDILMAAKPLLAENKCVLTIVDDIVCCGNRIYVKATATITNAEGQSVSTTAFAREEESRKGMDASQLTGATSSYARKYALNGLFAIDDNKDADALNTHGKKAEAQEPEVHPDILEAIAQAETLDELNGIYRMYSGQLGNSKVFLNALSTRKKQVV